MVSRKLFLPISVVFIALLTGCLSLSEVECPVRVPDFSFSRFAQPDCAFCKIVEGKAPATVILETPDIIVIKKQRSTQGVNCLIIPKKHIKDIQSQDFSVPYDVTIGSKIEKVAQDLSKMLTGSGDFKLTSNNGPAVGQTVFHRHVHFVASNSQWKLETGL